MSTPDLKSAVSDTWGVDIGGGFVRIVDSKRVIQLPNTAALARGLPSALIADATAAVPDRTSLSFSRPIERGYVVDWLLQSRILRRGFALMRGLPAAQAEAPAEGDEHGAGQAVAPALSEAERAVGLVEPGPAPMCGARVPAELPEAHAAQGLLLTVPTLPLPPLQVTLCDALIRELPGMYSVGTLPAALAGWWGAIHTPGSGVPTTEAALHIDSGFSATHCCAIQLGSVLPATVRRVDVGGKLLTNYMKELLSQGQLHVGDATDEVDDAKCALAYCSPDYTGDAIAFAALKSASTPAVLRDVYSAAHPNLSLRDISPELVFAWTSAQFATAAGAPDDCTGLAGAWASVPGAAELLAAGVHLWQSYQEAHGSSIAAAGCPGGSPGHVAPVATWVLPDQVATTRGYAQSSCSDPYADRRAQATATLAASPSTREAAADAAAAAVLPDANMQMMPVGRERVAVPEVLFHPADIGLPGQGIAAAVVATITAAPEYLHPALATNIVLSGGAACIPGIQARLTQELTAMLPAHFQVRVRSSPTPMLDASVGLRWAIQAGKRHSAALGVTVADLRKSGDRAPAVLDDHAIEFQQALWAAAVSGE